jgi:hypothetical protein
VGLRVVRRGGGVPDGVGVDGGGLRGGGGRHGFSAYVKKTGSRARPGREGSAVSREVTQAAPAACLREHGDPPLDTTYRDSPLVHDGRAERGALRAGDRAPDAPVVDADGRAVRLFDLFRGPHATVLVRPDGYIGSTTPTRGRVSLPTGASPR